MKKIKPLGFSQAKLVALNVLYDMRQWKKAIVIGAEHIKPLLSIPDLTVIDVNPKLLYQLRKSKVVTIFGDGYARKNIDYIVKEKPDMVYINLHGALPIAKALNKRLSSADLLSIVGNRHKKDYARMNFKMDNLREGLGRGVVYLARRIK